MRITRIRFKFTTITTIIQSTGGCVGGRAKGQLYGRVHCNWCSVICAIESPSLYIYSPVTNGESGGAVVQCNNKKNNILQ